MDWQKIRLTQNLIDAKAAYDKAVLELEYFTNSQVPPKSKKEELLHYKAKLELEYKVWIAQLDVNICGEILNEK